MTAGTDNHDGSPIAARPRSERAFDWLDGHSGHLVIVIFGMHALALTAAFWPYLTNDVVSAFSPSSIDAIGYTARARTMFGDFSGTFADAIRLPGYPLFLAVLDAIFGEPWRVARVLQLLGSSALVLMAWFAVHRLTGDRLAALAAAGAVAVWPPIHYWVPLLYAEALSVFFLGVLLCVLASGRTRNTVAVAVMSGILVAVLTYLKPNHLGLVVPAALMLTAVVPRRRALAAVLSTATALVVLAPWLVFTSAHHPGVVLATTQGWNLALGAGLLGRIPEGTLPARWGRAVGLDTNQPNITEEQAAPRHRELTRAALAQWQRRPDALVVYGVAKVLHAFGFSLRRLEDLAGVAFTIAASATAVWLWRRPELRGLVLFLAGIAAAVTVQAFVFLPNQRFRAALFDPIAAIVIGAGIALLACRGTAEPAVPYSGVK